MGIYYFGGGHVIGSNLHASLDGSDNPEQENWLVYRLPIHIASLPHIIRIASLHC